MSREISGTDIGHCPVIHSDRYFAISDRLVTDIFGNGHCLKCLLTWANAKTVTDSDRYWARLGTSRRAHPQGGALQETVTSVTGQTSDEATP